ncbi:MAG: SPOR domain-containing protein [Pseudomonadota bacterium]|nr:SPOR domain-containing protein [Pseudomonadota bacterium]
MFARMLLVWLLVLNLGVLAWWALHRPAVAESGMAADTSIPRLQLLEEAASLPLPAPAAEAQTAPDLPQPEIAEAAMAAQASPVCASFGPFTEESQASDAAARLRNAGATVKLRQESGGSHGYNVQLPPLASAAAANAMAARLREAGFNDLVVIKQGEGQNGIALGRFGSEENARRHQAALRAKGFRAQILPSGSSSRFWLDVQAPADFNAAAERRAIKAPRVRNIRC